MKELIGQRIRDLRNQLNLSQEELAKEFGFGWTRQTVGDVENGKRDVKAFELAKISNILHSDVSYFLKSGEITPATPYILWRERPVEHKMLEAFFIKKCRDFKLVEGLNNVKEDDYRKLPCKKFDLLKATYEDVSILAEEIRKELNLGDCPASGLKAILEDKYGVKFLFENLEEKGSAASSISDFGSAIIVNSKEPVWRQNFSVAHELFHLITWDENSFKQIQEKHELHVKNENLADAFASGLLVPSESLNKQIKIMMRDNAIHISELIAIARQFEVSLSALIWRMVNVRLINQKTAKEILANDEVLKLDKQNRIKAKDEYSVSRRFMHLAYLAYQTGEISRSRLASMLSIPLGDLSMVLDQFGLVEIQDHEIALSNT